MVPNILITVSSKKEKLPLSVTHPELAKEADGWDPNNLTLLSSKVNWRCKKGHIWLAPSSDRIRGQGCAVCAGKQIQIGVNDLGTTHPLIAKDAHGWNPETTTASSNKKKDWICHLKHLWTASPNSRTSGKSGCPICGGRSLLVGFNDLATRYPIIAAEAFGWDPSQVLSGSNLRKTWRCGLGHSWDTQINMRVSQQTGCPVCSGHKLQSGFNDLGTSHPELAKEAFGWDPKTISAGSHKKMSWNCHNGHRWDADVHSRASGVGCPVCKNKKLLTGYNDLKTTHPELAMQADGWDPALIIAGSNKNQGWICAEGHRWKTSPNKRTSGRRGCPSCANTSFDPNKDGWLYLLNNDEWGMLKVGITNAPKNRVALHISRNWELVDLRGPLVGQVAKDWESAILRMLKTKGADLSNDKIAGKFDGYSEAWSKSTLRVNSIKELMQLTEELDDNV